MEAMHNLLVRQLRKQFGPGYVPPPEWQRLVEAVNAAYRDFDADRALVEHSLRLSSDELFSANSQMQAVLQALPDLVFRLDHQGVILSFNASEATDPSLRAQDMVGRRIQDKLVERSAGEFDAALRRVAVQNATVSLECSRTVAGQLLHYEARLVPLLENQIVAIIRNTTESKRAEAELAKAQRELLDVSRQAGMAEVATAVLHNVGNVLNSVNVSATLAADQVRQTKAVDVARLASLIAHHTADLGDFLTKDSRGRNIPAYLGTLAETLAAEQKLLTTELDHLRKKIEHIKDIVTTQQSYARTAGISEIVAVSELIEDVLHVTASAPTRHTIAVHRDFQVHPVVTTDKHRVMQILVNLLRNAMQACDESDRADRGIITRLTGDERSIKIAVIDNGIGIPAANLTRIFNHGFTTRAGGHGFGLHSSALAAKALGGSLRVHSEGLGAGATFILDLPLSSEKAAA